MKKLTMKAMALGMAASFVLFGMTACTSTTVDEPSQSSDESIEIGGATSGGWTVEDGDIIDDDLVVFDNAMEGLLGVDYTPIALVATQVVSGRNYCFLAKATPVVQDPVSYYTFVTSTKTSKVTQALQISLTARFPVEQQAVTKSFPADGSL